MSALSVGSLTSTRSWWNGCNACSISSCWLRKSKIVSIFLNLLTLFPVKAGASWVGLGCYFEQDPAIQWRLCIATQAIAPLLLLLGSSWIPESPRYLVLNDRHEEGMQVLKLLHSSKDDPDHQFATAEFTQIKLQIDLDRENELAWLSLWRKPNTRKRMIYGFLVIAIAQSSGVLVSSEFQFK
jgi:hypothetical protein